MGLPQESRDCRSDPVLSAKISGKYGRPGLELKKESPRPSSRNRERKRSDSA